MGVSLLRWCLEWLGIGLIAIAAWFVQPFFALLVIGVYLVLIANINDWTGTDAGSK